MSGSENAPPQFLVDERSQLHKIGQPIVASTDKAIQNLNDELNAEASGTLVLWSEEEFIAFCHETVKAIEILGTPEEQRKARDQMLKWMLKGKFMVFFMDKFERSDIQEVIMRLAKKGLLIHKWKDGSVGQGRLTSVYGAERAREILGEEDLFDEVLGDLEETFDRIKLWHNHYTTKGAHFSHCDDGYEEGARFLMNQLEAHKIMTFTLNKGKKSEWKFSFNVHHGMGVLMSDEVGGVTDKTIQHEGGNAEHTGFTAVDIRLRSKKVGL